MKLSKKQFAEKLRKEFGEDVERISKRMAQSKMAGVTSASAYVDAMYRNYLKEHEKTLVARIASDDAEAKRKEMKRQRDKLRRQEKKRQAEQRRIEAYRINEIEFSQISGIKHNDGEAQEQLLDNQETFKSWRRKNPKGRIMWSINGGVPQEFNTYNIFPGNASDGKNFRDHVYSLDKNGDLSLHGTQINMWIVPDTITGKRYTHNLKYGSMNCFLKVAKETLEQYNDAHKERRMKKIARMMEMYDGETKGVPMTQVDEIGRQLCANLEFYNKVGEEYYNFKYSNGNYPTIKYIITEIDHVETYRPEMFDLSKKVIQYVPDVQQAYNNLSKNWKAYSVSDPCTKAPLYFWDDSYVYKHESCAEYDEGCYFITSPDKLAETEFFSSEVMQNNRINSVAHPELFKFIMDSCHDATETYFLDNIPNAELYGEEYEECYNVDLSQVEAYDKCKAYACYPDCYLYNEYKMPATGKLEYYSVEAGKFNTFDLIKKCGFARITNISYDGCNENTKKILQKLNYYMENNVYPTPVLRFAWDNGVRFNVNAVAFTKWNTDITYTEDMIKKKQYQKICGLMRCAKPYDKITFKFENEEELKDIKAVCEDRIYPKGFNGEMVYLKPKKSMTNNAHLASFILGYSFVNVTSKLLQIPFEDIAGIRVDCILSMKKYDHLFNLNDNIHGWKKEKKGLKVVYPYCNFTQNNVNTVDFELPLTARKLSYGKVNFVTGSAGTGKTTGLFQKFGDVDERLSNSILCIPNNNLRATFKALYKDIYCYTYHKALLGGMWAAKKHGIELKYITDVVVDEATMIGKEDMRKIMKTCEEAKVNLIICGDFDPKTKKLYQLTPTGDKSFLLDEDLKIDEIYHVHLTKIWRQGDDKAFAEFLQKCRGMHGREITQIMRGFNTIDLTTIYDLYREGDQIIAATNEIVDMVNAELFKRSDRIQIKYKTTTKKYAKNQTAIIDKKDFSPITMDLAFCMTAHLVQGMTYKNKIFIITTNMFEESHMYVCLSRAQSKNQIYIINDVETSKTINDDERVIISKRIQSHRMFDKERGFKCNLTVKHIQDLKAAQKGKCWHCGIDVLFTGYERWQNTAFSIDRIDDSKGHEKGNVRIACFACNCRHRNTLAQR